MIISCPNCHTRYQLAEHAIGSAGRKVSCAQCQESWHAIPEADAPPPTKPVLVPDPDPQDPDKLFSAEEEAELDADFEEAAGNGVGEDDNDEDDTPAKPEIESYSIADIKNAGAETSNESDPASLADKIDAGLKGKRLQAMKRRHLALAKKLPLGRVRSGMRLVLLILFALLVGSGIIFRTEIVRVVPDMAGVYAGIGLSVNVIGLDFENVETLRTMQNGVDVMLVSGQVRNITGQEMPVPAILVSILDGAGASLYSWSVTPLSPFIAPYGKQEFEARLNAAPQNAANVKLTFAEVRAK